MIGRDGPGALGRAATWVLPAADCDAFWPGEECPSTEVVDVLAKAVGGEAGRAGRAIDGDGIDGAVKAGVAIGGAVIEAKGGSVAGGAMAGAVIAGALKRVAVIGGIRTDGTLNAGLPGCSDKGRVLLVAPAGGARLSVMMPLCAIACVDWATVAADSNAKPTKPRRIRCLPALHNKSLYRVPAIRGTQDHAKASSTTPAPISPIAPIWVALRCSPNTKWPTKAAAIYEMAVAGKATESGMRRNATM